MCECSKPDRSAISCIFRVNAFIYICDKEQVIINKQKKNKRQDKNTKCPRKKKKTGVVVSGENVTKSC